MGGRLIALLTTFPWAEGGWGLPPPASQGEGGAGRVQCCWRLISNAPPMVLFLFKREIVLKGGHWGLGDKSSTEVRE